MANLNTSQTERMAIVKCCGMFTSVDYLSRTGKWLTFSRLMALMFIPIVGAWAFTLYSLVDNVVMRDDTKLAQDYMFKSVYIGRLIYRIQKERDMTLLFISKIGPGTKAFLIRDYDGTDTTISEIWAWPDEFAAHPQKEFRSKKKLSSHINRFRTQLDPSSVTPKDTLDFYTNIVDFFIDWLVYTIKETGFSNIWKSLVVFHKITRCMLDTGAERAYGTIFFAQGNFPEVWFYDLYFRRIHRFNSNYRSATYYSNLVDPLRHEQTDQKNITFAIQSFRNVIKYSNISVLYASAESAQSYFDNVTIRVDYLYSLQEEVAVKITSLINEDVHIISINIIIYCVTVALVIMACPVVVYFADLMTSYTQMYSMALDRASKKLNEEQSMTDSLLRQMLPALVVQDLKNGVKIESQFFKSATVLFSGIVNFTQMSIEYGPMELVGLLNLLYTSIDEQIENHDVYKVETINDTYMVVSGVPMPNGIRHATEIANFALDINNLMRKMAYDPQITIPMQLQLGASSGFVSAGIIGRATLRYCLFGDTVNIASRMKSYSLPSRIHISESLFKLLERTKTFHLQARGTIEVKGKGKMNTYWLMDGHRKPEFPVGQHQNWRLPGQSESLDSPLETELEVVVEQKSTGKNNEDPIWG